ncbi:MAG TPA: glycosyltransferase, partial [Armatimonadetes bacterium]|nr:glycosyltransferase [Armatimonadota bacterium]
MLLILAARLLTQKPPPAQASVYMLGVPVCTLNMERVLQRIEEFIAERQPRIIVTADTSALIRAQEDTEFRDIIRNADIVTPDGIGVVLAARLLGFPLTQRVSGVDLMRRLCELAGQRGYRIFLLGARPGVVERAAMRLRQLYPTLTIVGMHHGYFDASQELHIIKCIRDAHPDILFVAMGIPKQEKWIAKHLNELNVPVSIGVGGSFDVYAGVAKRAPRWVQRLCLEWLYRALREPHRVKRLIAIPKLLILVARSILR